MPTVREFFLAEANTYLEKLRGVVQSATGTVVDAGELHRLARGLRGSAQMARADNVQRAAQVVESAARTFSSGGAQWNADAQRRMSDTIEDLEVLVQSSEGVRQMEARVAAVAARWMESGLPTDAAGLQRGGDEDFRRYAAREVSTLADHLQAAIDVLEERPLDRDPLKAILRHQRALLGSARLEEMPVLTETLQTIDEVTRLIARLNVGVEGEWLEVYRCAREVLAGIAPGLERGETSAPPGTAASRLRNARQELLERYGAALQQGAPAAAGAQAQSPAAPAAPPASAPSPEPAAEPEAAPLPELEQQAAPESDEAEPEPDTSDIVGIETLLYRGNDALDRALELRAEIERETGSDSARAAVEELFDLIELART